MIFCEDQISKYIIFIKNILLEPTDDQYQYTKLLFVSVNEQPPQFMKFKQILRDWLAESQVEVVNNEHDVLSRLSSRNIKM